MPVPDLLCSDDFGDDLWSLICAAPRLPLEDPKSFAIAPGQLFPVLKKLNLLGTAAAAGLWLLAGDLDQSHRISQDLHDADGAYWHGIMHRLEGDYWNAKYWMRRAAHHPVREQLVQVIDERRGSFAASNADSANQRLIGGLRSSDSVAESLIDLVERAVNKQTGCSAAVPEICWWEWQLLLRHCLV